MFEANGPRGGGREGWHALEMNGLMDIMSVKIKCMRCLEWFLEIKTLEFTNSLYGLGGPPLIVFVLTLPNIYFRTKSNFQEYTKDFWYGLSHFLIKVEQYVNYKKETRAWFQDLLLLKKEKSISGHLGISRFDSIQQLWWLSG